jgi:hypothetical protein
VGAGYKSGGGNGWTFDSLVKAIRHSSNGVNRLLPRAERQRVAELLVSMPERVEQDAEARRHYSIFHFPSRSCQWCRGEAIAISVVDRLARTNKGGRL